jgi:hypothetical protein
MSHSQTKRPPVLAVDRMTSDASRARHIAERSIEELKLDLGGLAVYTEAASGHYLYTPLVAALAGADSVFAVTETSHFGRREDIAAMTVKLAQDWAVADRLAVRFEKAERDVAASDIVTNSGFVRPIDRTMIGWMKATAVIPLMFETWETRDGEIDLVACREKGILVLGTREDRAPHSLYPYCGFTAMKLLFELGLEGYRTRVALLGRGILGASIHQVFTDAGIDVEWFGDGGARAHSYESFRGFWSRAGSAYDVVLLADHSTRGPLVGTGGLITPDELLATSPAICVGVIAGQADFDALRGAGIRLFPERPRPFGYMSYQPDALGPRAVLELYAAGLKVGEAMARARRAGCSPDETRRRALRESPAMDFAHS